MFGVSQLLAGDIETTWKYIGLLCIGLGVYGRVFRVQAFMIVFLACLLTCSYKPTMCKVIGGAYLRLVGCVLMFVQGLGDLEAQGMYISCIPMYICSYSPTPFTVFGDIGSG